MDLLEINIPNWEKWLKALRSGRYKKTQGALFRLADATKELGDSYKAGFCCLGVVSKISRVGKFGSPFNSTMACTFTDNVKTHDGWKFRTRDESGSYLTRRVQQWLGIDDHNPEMDFGKDPKGGWLSTRPDEQNYRVDYFTAADLNDKWGLELDQIADMLEYFIVNPAKKAQSAVAES